MIFCQTMCIMLQRIGIIFVIKYILCAKLLIYRFTKYKGQIAFAPPVHRDKPPQMSHHYLWGTKQLNIAYTTQYAQYSGEFFLFAKLV